MPCECESADMICCQPSSRRLVQSNYDSLTNILYSGAARESEVLCMWYVQGARTELHDERFWASPM